MRPGSNRRDAARSEARTLVRQVILDSRLWITRVVGVVHDELCLIALSRGEGGAATENGAAHDRVGVWMECELGTQALVLTHGPGREVAR